MEDTQLAQDIRAKVEELHKAIAAARDAGLEVFPPILLQQYLVSGHAPGGPDAWTIKRRSLLSERGVLPPIAHGPRHPAPPEARPPHLLVRWTPQDDAQLIELWQAGVTQGEIEGMMGRGHNAVSGRVHRLRKMGVMLDHRSPEQRQKTARQPKRSTRSVDMSDLPGLSLSRKKTNWKNHRELPKSKQELYDMLHQAVLNTGGKE